MSEVRRHEPAAPQPAGRGWTGTQHWSCREMLLLLRTLTDETGSHRGSGPVAEGPAPAEVCRGPTLGRLPPWWSEGTSDSSPSDLSPEAHFSLSTIQMGQALSGSSSQLAIRGSGSSLVSLTLARTVQPPGPGRGMEGPPGRPRPARRGLALSALCPWLGVIHTPQPCRGGSGKAPTGAWENRTLCGHLAASASFPSVHGAVWRG